VELHGLARLDRPCDHLWRRIACDVDQTPCAGDRQLGIARRRRGVWRNGSDGLVGLARLMSANWESGPKLRAFLAPWPRGISVPTQAGCEPAGTTAPSRARRHSRSTGRPKPGLRK